MFFGEKLAMKLVRLKIACVALVFALLAPGLVDSKPPPHLRQQANNCWLQQVLYALLSMPELTDYVRAHKTDFKDGSFEHAYAQLVQAIDADPAGDGSSLRGALAKVQTAAIALCNTTRPGMKPLGPTDSADLHEFFTGSLDPVTYAPVSAFFQEFWKFLDARITQKRFKRKQFAFVDLIGAPEWELRGEISVRSSEKPAQDESWFCVAQTDHFEKMPPYVLINVSIQEAPEVFSPFPLSIDLKKCTENKRKTFRESVDSTYELVMFGARIPGGRHRVNYVKDQATGEWYYANDLGSEFYTVKAPGWRKDSGNKPYFTKWGVIFNFEPTLLLYRNKSLMRNELPGILREKLEKLSGSLKILTGQLVKK